MGTEMDMDLGLPAMSDGGGGVGSDMETGTAATRTAVDTMVTDEILAHEVSISFLSFIDVLRKCLERP